MIHVAAWIVFAWLFWKGFRYVSDRSTVVGILFVLAVAARLVSGLALFAISYFELPIAASLQSGGGFWHLAPDARGYYDLAVQSLGGDGVAAPAVEQLAPAFVKTLTLWMALVGTSPLSATFLNIMLYVAVVAAIVWCVAPVNAWRQDLPAIVATAAYSFSPALLIHSTQPLKEGLSSALAVLACVGVLALRPLVYGLTRKTFSQFALGAVLVFASVVSIAGIRWYYAVLMWASIALTVAFFTFWIRRTRLRVYLAASLLLLVSLGAGVAVASGPYVVSVILTTLGLGSGGVFGLFVDAREGFIVAGGATNIVSIDTRDSRHIVSTDARDSPHSESTDARDSPHTVASDKTSATRPPRAAPPQRPGAAPPPRPGTALDSIVQVPASDSRTATGWRHEFRKLSIGLGTVFLPPSVFTWLLGIAEFGGRGLLPIVDIDTVFQNAAILFVVVLLWQRRRDIGAGMPLVIFGVVVALSTAAMIGYTVTNFGTLWRLRLLVAVPLWMMVLSLSLRARGSGGDMRDPEGPAALGSNRDLDVVRGFGEEWERFNQRGMDENETRVLFERYFAGFPWTALPAGAAGFDAGCGSGRWARLVAPQVGTLHCIDASEAALRVAQDNLADRPNCVFHLASVDTMPLPDRGMDFGYSLGVLHHVPDTASALRSCVTKLKPGAPFLLYLYYRFDNRPAWFRAVWAVSDRIRRVVSRAPFGLRSAICDVIALAVYWPLARAARLAESAGLNVGTFPLSTYRNQSFYVMRTDALDRFGTALEQRFTQAEMREMMEGAGLSRIEFSETEPFWVALGWKREF